ncbi:MAG: holo-[acyl-carrier-protein] synthase [Candidatus Marinimicrobia bacterium]|nr:holo-[acyl-carrier-protein] synthase [Candidatus Neomarinimicrobiota bacterium]|tara:strand:+ start:1088 stop:1471 length:384 start_codon:yes stop_codon:yes gene_type:complete
MVGTDIIEISRIEKLIKEKGDKFLNRIYTQNEIDYCESKGLNKFQHYAGRFAAKEAVFKVLNGKADLESSLTFKNIEILNKNDGAPYVNILDDIMIDCFDINVDVSISHIKKYATATAILVNPPFRP